MDVDMAEDGEKFVWPWTGILVNITIRRVRNGQYVGMSGRELKNELMRRGFDPVRVRPLWNKQGHSGNAVVEFKRGWVGFHDALLFARAYEADSHGRWDWYASNETDAGLYAWIARESDYNSYGIVGEYLTKAGDLKTVSEFMEEEARKHDILVSHLKRVIELKDKHLQEMQEKNDQVSWAVHQFTVLKEKLNAAIDNIRMATEDQLQRVLNSHEKFKLCMESQAKELELSEFELKERQARIDRETNNVVKGTQRKNSIQDCSFQSLDWPRADQNVATLAKDQVEDRGEPELEIEQLGWKLRVKRRRRSVSEECTDKEGSHTSIQILQSPVLKEPEEHVILHEACQDLIKVMEKAANSSWIGTMKNEDVKTRPVPEVLELKYNEEHEAERKLSALCYLWKEYLNNTALKPFPLTSNEGMHSVMKKVANGSWIGPETNGDVETRLVSEVLELKCSEEQEAERKLSVLCYLWMEYMNNTAWKPFPLTLNVGMNSEVICAEKEQLQGLMKPVRLRQQP
ncbi:hypothetical protein CDL15_Pgr022591 [Punica granatum]|nr:hypothetical protein CDL15_Pgr022591 [Punica granatum]